MIQWEVSLSFPLGGGCDKTHIEEIYQKIKDAVFQHQISFNKYSNTFTVLAKQCPQLFLDTFLLPEEISHHINGGDRGNPFESIDTKDALIWCSQGGSVRYLRFISVIQPFTGQSFTDTALQILEKSPDVEVVIKQFTQSCLDTYWRDYRELDNRLLAFETLLDHKNSLVSKSASDAIQQISKHKEKRRLENEEYNKREQKFEW